MHTKTSGKDWIWEPTRQAIYERDGRRCVVCLDSDRLSLDHVDPRGSNRPDNLVTLCIACNTSKHDSELADWWTPETVRRCREAAAKPLTRELRAAGRARAHEARPQRFAAHRARALKQKHPPSALPGHVTEAPF